MLRCTMVQTIDEILAELGGVTAVAKAMGCNVQAVYRWKIRGVPHKYRHTIMSLAATYGAVITRKDIENASKLALSTNWTE